jgi:signal transduction histidine kinase
MSSEKNDQSVKGQHSGGHSELLKTPEPTVAMLKEALELADKKLQVVGSVTRHDVLNQMTAIMGYNELLRTMVDDEKLLHFLEIEHRASEKIRRIFAYSKVFQNIGSEAPVWQELARLVWQAREEIDTGMVAVLVDDGTASIYADPLMAKVFAYILENAVLHGKKTTEIRIRLKPADHGAILSVEDNGVGVAPEDKEKIFEKGFGKKTGWGLYITREILAANGMQIRETGTAGTGARFEILMPSGRVRTAPGAPLQ